MSFSKRNDTGHSVVSRSTLPQRWLRRATLLVAAAVLSGCGGGGSSGGDVVQIVPSRSITAGNVESATKLVLEMIDITDVLVTSWGLGGGIGQTFCESGDGIGTVNNCVIGSNTFNGSVSSSITDTISIQPPGETLNRDMPAKLSLAINSLQWQSSNNRAVYSVNGNLQISYTYPLSETLNGLATITGTLTLTDTRNNIRYQYRNLSQRYSMSIDLANRSGYQLRHSDHRGAVIYMDENLQYQLTGRNILEHLALIGHESRMSLGVSDNIYSISLDSDNDGNFDIFANMPLSELGKGHTTSNAAPAVSITRLGGIGLTVNQGSRVTLVATANDADYNLHTLSWSLTAVPAGATGDKEPRLAIINQRTSQVSFAGEVAGEYEITATAQEVGTSSPATASGRVRIRVKQRAPEVEIPNLDNAVGVVGDDPVSFPIQPQNPDGLITATLVTAPAGMTITGDAASGYQLHWDPQPQFFPGMTETVTLGFSNEDNQTVQSWQVTVSDSNARPPLVTPGLTINNFSTGALIANVDGDAAGELLLAGDGSVFYGLDLGGSTPVAAMTNPYLLDADAENLIAVMPLRRNGVARAYAIATSRGVFVVNAGSHAVEASRGLQLNVTSQTSKRRLAVADVNGDGNDEILVLTKTGGSALADQLFLLNQSLATLAATEQQPLGQEFLIGNVDTDSDLEIVCGNGAIFNAATLAPEMAAGVLFGNRNYVLADVDADGRQEVVETSVGEIAVFDIDTATRTLISVGLNAENLNLFGVNADADAADELVIGTTTNLIHIYSINKPAAIATLDRSVGTTIGSSTVTEVARGNVAGDSADELVYVSRSSSGGPQISVAELSGNLLIDGAEQTLATGSFAAATPADTRATDSFFAASILANGVAARGVLSVDASGEPAPLLLDAAAGTALFIAAADIDGNDQQDLLASTILRGETDTSLLAQLTGVSGWELPAAASTPAPLTALQLDGTGNLETAYIERNGPLFDEVVSLVVREVGSVTEIDRLELQSSGPLTQLPVAIAVANLDGDTDPDIVLLSTASLLGTTSLQVFEYVAGSLEARTPNGIIDIQGVAKALAIADVDGDGIDEIAVTQSGLNDALQIYDGELTLTASGDIPDPTSALTFHAADNARPLWLAGSHDQVIAIDAQSMLPQWTSPHLHGEVTSINVHNLDDGDQLRVGTDNAIYRSQP